MREKCNRSERMRGDGGGVGGVGEREAAGRPLKVTPEESDSSRLPSKLLLFIHIYPFLVHPAPGRSKYCE